MDHNKPPPELESFISQFEFAYLSSDPVCLKSYKTINVEQYKSFNIWLTAILFSFHASASDFILFHYQTSFYIHDL